MSGQHSTQIVSVSLALAGEQQGRIDVQHAGTPDARLTLLWGSLMLTLTSPTQTAHVLDVWQRAARLARALPLLTNPHRGLDHRINTPGVVTTLHGLPRWDVQVVPDHIANGHRTPRHVAVRLGGLTWLAHDQTAASSTCGLFARAHVLAPTVFGS